MLHVRIYVHVHTLLMTCRLWLNWPWLHFLTCNLYIHTHSLSLSHSLTHSLTHTAPCAAMLCAPGYTCEVHEPTNTAYCNPSCAHPHGSYWCGRERRCLLEEGNCTWLEEPCPDIVSCDPPCQWVALCSVDIIINFDSLFNISGVKSFRLFRDLSNLGGMGGNDVYSFNETLLFHEEALSANFIEECLNNNFTLTATNAIGDSEPAVYVLSLLEAIIAMKWNRKLCLMLHLHIWNSKISAN